MLVEHLQEFLKTCDPKATVNLNMTVGMMHRVNKGILIPNERDDNLFELTHITKDGIGSVILGLEPHIGD